MNHRTACTAAAIVIAAVLALAAAPSLASAGTPPAYQNPKYKPTKPFPGGIKYGDNIDIKKIARTPNRFNLVKPGERDELISMCWAYMGHMWIIREIKEWFIHRVTPSDLACSGIMHTHKDCFPEMFYIWPFVKEQNAFNLLKHCHVYHHYKGEATPGWHGPRQPFGNVLPVPPRKGGKKNGKGGKGKNHS